MIIRREQMEAFCEVAVASFENEMVAHSQEFSPTLCRIIGEDQLRVALRSAIDRAAVYGFTLRGPIRLFIEMRFLFGSAFDTDPQYPWAAAILESPDDEMQRAEALHLGTMDYLEQVSGPDNIHTRNALEELLAASRQPPLFPSPEHFVPAILNEMTRIFPRKAAYIGEEGLLTLIEEGREEAQTYGFPPVRGEGLLVVLKYAFGHGCTADPLYPWISRTLNDPLIIDGAGRAERLENKATVWLSHVLAAPPERTRP